MSKNKKTILWRVLAGYVFIALFVTVLTGTVAFMLIRKYIVTTNFSDLMKKAGITSQMLSRPDGRISYLTLRGLFELESICDAQLLYVDSEMVARRMPVKKHHKSGGTNESNEENAYNGGTSDKTDATDKANDVEKDEASASQESSANDKKKNSAHENSILDIDPAYKFDKAQQAIPPISEVLRLLNRIDFFDIIQNKPETDVDDEPDDNAPLERIDLSGTLDEALIRSIMSGEVATDERFIQALNSYVMFAGMPITDIESGKVVAAIILCRPVDEISVMTVKMIYYIAWAGIVALFFAALIAFFISRNLTRPIQKMSVVAQSMSMGQYGARCAVDRNDELGRLGSTLDLLSQRLSDVIGNLNAEKTKLEKVLSAIGEGIVAVDVNGKIIHHNASALELLGIKNWDELSPDPDKALIVKKLMRIMSDSVLLRQNASTSWKTITGRAIEAEASPVIDGENDVFGAVCLIKDVTEAQKTEQMRRDFIANISHELRTPLTGIRGMVEPLMDGLMQTEKEKRDCYNVIYNETIRLEKLIKDMLDLSRLQSGRVGVELEPMPPVDLLHAVKRRMTATADEAGIELTVEGDPNLAVMGNEDRIIQILIILTDNALSFTPPGGKITLYARDAEECVEIGVTDTGSGVDPVDLPYIWERFYKADRSRMRTSGTGLGLAIAKMAVEAMKGRIDVRTKSGVGSTFFFTLQKARKEC